MEIKRPKQRAAKELVAETALVAKRLKEIKKPGKVKETGEPMPAAKDLKEPALAVGDLKKKK